MTPVDVGREECDDLERNEEADLDAVRSMARSLLSTASPYWHYADGHGGLIFQIIAEEAQKMRLPVDPRGAAAGISATEAYQAASLRLANLRRDVLQLAARDGLKCHYCGEDLNTSTLQVDHVIPRSKGGSSALSNLVLACPKCNGKKGAQDYDAFVTQIRNERS